MYISSYNILYQFLCIRRCRNGWMASDDGPEYCYLILDNYVSPSFKLTSLRGITHIMQIIIYSQGGTSPPWVCI